MPNNYYQLYNHAYSFSSSTVSSGGITFSLPQNDYGIYGKHVDAYFNTITNSEGATGSLAAWFVSDKGLTYYSQTLGATAAITGYVQGRFPVTSSTTGLGLIDLRGSADWVKIVGDGIVGPTKASSATVSGTNAGQYVTGVSVLFSILKTQYPNIEWAIAGLPHLPFQMVYAPVTGQSPTWDPSLTNNGDYSSPSWWDPQHPTGNSNVLWDWQTAPQDLKNFYETLVTDGIQKSVLDSCPINWICPDIRVPYTDALTFYEYGYNPEANYRRNKRLCELSWDRAQESFIKSNALISTMYPSRGLNRFDDPQAIYGTFDYNDTTSTYDIVGSSFSGSSGSASESYYPSITYRHDMIQAAVDGNVSGFIFYEPMVSVVEIACTGDISVGATGYAAQVRARNMFSTILYGGSYEDGYVPLGGYTSSCVKTDLLRFASNNTVAYLNEIRESVNIAVYGSTVQRSVLGAKNGWIRSANDPTLGESTLYGDSTNSSASDDQYGGQQWAAMGGDTIFCECPPPPCETNPIGTNPLACCCFDVFRCPDSYNADGDVVCCGAITVRGAPNGNPACEGAAACTCDPVVVKMGKFLGDLDSCRSVNNCSRDVYFSIGCQCVEGSTADVAGCQNPPCGEQVGIGCLCAENCPNPDKIASCVAGNWNGQVVTTSGEDADVRPPLFRSTYANFAGNNTTDQLVLVHDIQNYKRANSKHFILTRAFNQTTSDWKNVYGYEIEQDSYRTFVQGGQTILNPSVSAPAIRTHSNKEVMRHLPNQYFTT